MFIRKLSSTWRTVDGWCSLVGECEWPTFDEAFRLSLLNPGRFLLAVRINDVDVTSLLLLLIGFNWFIIGKTERLIGLGL